MKIQNKDVLKPIFYFTTHLYNKYILYLNFTSTDIYSVVTSFTPVCRKMNFIFFILIFIHFLIGTIM